MKNSWVEVPDLGQMEHLHFALSLHWMKLRFLDRMHGTITWGLWKVNGGRQKNEARIWGAKKICGRLPMYFSFITAQPQLKGTPKPGRAQWVETKTAPRETLSSYSKEQERGLLSEGEDNTMVIFLFSPSPALSSNVAIVITMAVAVGRVPKALLEVKPSFWPGELWCQRMQDKVLSFLLSPIDQSRMLLQSQEVCIRVGNQTLAFWLPDEQGRLQRSEDNGEEGAQESNLEELCMNS